MQHQQRPETELPQPHKCSLVLPSSPRFGKDIDMLKSMSAIGSPGRVPRAVWHVCRIPFMWKWVAEKRLRKRWSACLLIPCVAAFFSTVDKTSWYSSGAIPRSLMTLQTCLLSISPSKSPWRNTESQHRDGRWWSEPLVTLPLLNFLYGSHASQRTRSRSRGKPAGTK